MSGFASGPRAERTHSSAGASSRELRRLESELREARLPPHFLLNSLHVLGVTLRTEGRDETLRVLEHLGRMLRHVIDADRRRLVPLREEVAFAESCVALERARTGISVEFSGRVGEGALEIPVPSLVLQPLVENAVRHGVRARERRGIVEIRAVRSERILDVAVLDDGPGLPDGWRFARDAGTGLRAVEARLECHADAGASLSVRNRTSRSGLEARIQLPIS